MAISSAITSAAIKSFSDVLGRLASDHAARILAPDRADRIRTDLTPHMESTYKRCSQIKTLLNPNEPAEFLEIYATQRFRAGARTFDQYGLVDWIRSEKNNIIVTGTGGSGKSMFMRYLWLSLFVFSEGRVPIFLELRSLNSVSNFDLTRFLYHTLSSGRSSISEKEFAKSLSNGDFIIILDGFDEISSDRRETVQAAIMELARNYPTTKIVVSGRPDEQFSSWSSFTVVGVSHLLHKDVVELIKKAPFDSTAKDKFYKKVKESEFYSSHESFLSNPLLASMMLLTFSYNYDIPNKMHLFYDQAFDALFQRHDSHKPGGYKREFNSNLKEDEFKRLLSFFCLITYYDQKFEFDKNSIIASIKKAISIENPSIDASDFLSDLTNCVCLIVRDGLTYSFAHRSFQEYFSAYCLAYVTSRNVRSILNRLAERNNDQAIPLLADMNPELFRESYVLPIAREYESGLQLTSRSKSIPKFLLSTGLEFHIRWIGDPRKEPLIMLSGSSELSRFVRLVRKLTPRTLPDSKALRANHERDVLAATTLLNGAGSESHLEVIIRGGDSFVFLVRKGANDLEPIGKQSSLDAAFRASAMFDYISDLMRVSATYIKTARAASGSSSDAMADIFGIE